MRIEGHLQPRADIPNDVQQAIVKTVRWLQTRYERAEADADRLAASLRLMLDSPGGRDTEQARQALAAHEAAARQRQKLPEPRGPGSN
jgi:hypothetical protein